MEQLRDHPEIEWAERTGFPSWAQEVLEDFENEAAGAWINDRAAKVLAAIPFHKENAIDRFALAEKVGLSDRQTRKIIEELRGHGYFILNDQDGKGYYRSYDPEEIYRAYRQERSRALAILRRMKEMRVLLKGAGLV